MPIGVLAPASPNQSAMHFWQETADRVWAEEKMIVADIVHLFTVQGLNHKAIWQQLGDRLPELDDVCERTRSKVIAAILVKELGQTTVATIAQQQAKARLEANRALCLTASKARLAEDGKCVWSDAEVAYFDTLIVNAAYQRGTGVRLNHEKIAVEMNRHFHTDKFSNDACRTFFAHRNLTRSKKAAAATTATTA